MKWKLFNFEERKNLVYKVTRQVYNLVQPVEQPHLGLSIVEEKNQTGLKTKQDVEHWTFIANVERIEHVKPTCSFFVF